MKREKDSIEIKEKRSSFLGVTERSTGFFLFFFMAPQTFINAKGGGGGRSRTLENKKTRETRD